MPIPDSSPVLVLDPTRDEARQASAFASLACMPALGTVTNVGMSGVVSLDEYEQVHRPNCSTSVADRFAGAQAPHLVVRADSRRVEAGARGERRESRSRPVNSTYLLHPDRTGARWAIETISNGHSLVH